MTTIERIVLFIDSHHRTSGTPSNFVLSLASPVSKVLYCEVISAEIPYSFYGVTAINNTLVWTAGGTYAATVSPGNYTISQFVTALQSAMVAKQTGWTVQYSAMTYKLTFSNSVAFTLDVTNASGTTTMGKIIGLQGSTTSATTTVMPGVANVSGPRYLLIKSTALTRPKITRPFNNGVQDDVLYKVSIQGGPGDILIEKNVYSNLLRYGVRQKIQNIDFRLVDEDDNTIDLNGQEWSLSVNLLPG